MTTTTASQTTINLTRVQAELAKCEITSEIISHATDVLLVDLKVGNAQLVIVDPQALVDLTGDEDDRRWSFQIMDFDAADMLQENHMRASNPPQIVARGAISTFLDYVKSLSEPLWN